MIFELFCVLLHQHLRCEHIRSIALESPPRQVLSKRIYIGNVPITARTFPIVYSACGEPESVWRGSALFYSVGSMNGSKFN